MFLLVFILMLVTQHALGVEVIEGAESVVLPCEASSGKASSVTWSRKDLKPSDVHVRIKIDQAEEDDLTNQNELFKSRTEVQPDALTTGNISLTLKHIQLSDDGIYSCLVLGGRGERLTNTGVQLQVISKEEEELRKQEEELRKQQEEEARRQRDAGIAVGIIILCIVVAVLVWLYRLGYIWQKDLQVVDSGVESVLLPCRTIRLLPKDVRVKWIGGDSMVHESLKDSDQPGEQDKDYSGRTEMKRDLRILVDLSLTLKHPTVRHSNLYTCTVYSREGDVLMERHVVLQVKVPQVVVDSGVESVLLPCETTVQLPEDVRVQWTDAYKKKLHVFQKGSDQPGEQDDLYRGRTQMKRESPGDLSLTLKHPTERDNNLYTCTVYSREGHVLMVRQVGLYVKVQQVEVDSGVESVLLPCEAKVQLPEDVRVQWTDRDKMVHVSLKGSDQPGEQDDLYRGRTEMKRETPGDLSLTLKHPTDRDSNTYTCTVYSRDGDVQMERHVPLKVKVQQVEVDSGVESVLLPCETTVQLPEDVRVQWTEGDNLVHVYQKGSDQPEEEVYVYTGRTEMKRETPGDLSLTLKRPTVRDRNTYKCTVYSREGDVLMVRQVELLVKVQQVEVDSGVESVLLPCEGTDQLPENVIVEWTDRDMMIVHVSLKGSDPPGKQDDLYRGRTKMKRDLQRPGDLSLTLKHPTVRDSKTYTCTVYSMERDFLMERHVKLKVKEQEVVVEQGAESVLLPFKTTDLPEDIRVTWRRLDTMEMIHLFQNSSDRQGRQDPYYRGRTERKGDLNQGDVSLILKHPTERDRGRYICSVYSKKEDIRRETTVCLSVKVRQVKKKESVLQPEVPELKSTHEGYQLVNMDPAESC